MTHTRPRHAATDRPSAAVRGASAWVVDIRAWGLSKRQGPGQSHGLDIVAPAPEQTGNAVLEVPAGADVHVTGLLESASEGVVVTGTASATAFGSCARCLQDVRQPVVVRFRELFAYPDSTTAATTDDDEVPRLDDDVVDLAALVHDELVLAMPLAPLCRPDCAGLCPQCGQRLDALGPDHRHETMDPRWAALAGKFPAGSDLHTAPHQQAGPGARAVDTEEK